MNYTKGKWMREEVNDTMVCILAPDSDGEGETYQYIADIDPCGDGRFTQEEIEANAHLISAAPEMYEALTELYKEYLKVTTMPDEASRNAVKALYKAEGK